MVYASAATSPSAVVSGAVGRVFARSPLGTTAQAMVSDLRHRVFGRLVVAPVAAAQVVYMLSPVRTLLTITARAVATVGARVLTRSPVASTAAVQLALGLSMARIRAPLALVPSATVSATGVVFPRRNITSPTSTAGTAFVLPVPRALRRSPSITVAAAQATGPIGRVGVRSPGSSVARADVDISFDVIKQIPWDEPAPDERQFQVNPEPKVFYVVA